MHINYLTYICTSLSHKYLAQLVRREHILPCCGGRLRVGALSPSKLGLKIMKALRVLVGFPLNFPLEKYLLVP